MKSWIFREQPTDDYGIDSQIEVVDGEIVTGKLIALQIKSGPTYFRHVHADGWWFYIDQDDLDYWLRHSLPVIVVLFDEDSDTAYWQHVHPSALVATKAGAGKPRGRKLLVPRNQKLGSWAMPDLSRLADGDAFGLRLTRLRLALPWMRLLTSGRRLLLEADEWINKLSGRGDLQVVSVDDANEDRQELGTWTITAGLRSYAEVLPSLVPWAEVELHAETYEEADEDLYDEEAGHYDREDDLIWHHESYEDWLAGKDRPALRPYANAAGEVDSWRLELKLNDVGRAFLLIDQFAEGAGPVLAPDH
jgi:hypothetical protein